MNGQNLQQHVVASGVLDSPAAAKVTAGFTAASGVAGYFQLVQPVLAAISMVLGIVLSLLIIRKQLQQRREERAMHLQNLQNARLENLKYRLEIEAMEAAKDKREASQNAD